VTEAFIGEKEEGLVLALVNLRDPNRAARAEAEIVLLINRARSPAAVAEKAVGVQIVVAQEFIGAAVKIVRAGLGRKRHHAAAGVAVLRLESVRIQGDLGARFERGRVRETQTQLERARRVRRNPVQGGAIAGALPTAENKAIVPAEILRFRSQR